MYADFDKELETDVSGSGKSINNEKEGGIEGWLTVFGSSLVYFATFGIINSFGFFQELYKNKYLASTPASTIAFIGTLQITLMNVLAAPAGSLFDSYGLKVCRYCSTQIPISDFCVVVQSFS